MRSSVISLMWMSPSMPGSSSANAPKSASLRILTSMILPIG